MDNIERLKKIARDLAERYEHGELDMPDITDLLTEYYDTDSTYFRTHLNDDYLDDLFEEEQDYGDY